MWQPSSSACLPKLNAYSLDLTRKHRDWEDPNAAMLDTMAFDNSDSHEVPADIRLFLPLFFSRA